MFGTLCSLLDELRVTRVVAPLDVVIGPWRSQIREHRRLDLIRVCRGAEAWPLAAGLQLGGERPLLILTGADLFEAGDAMRNAIFDLRLPLYALLVPAPRLAEPALPENALAATDHFDSFVEPVLESWSLDYLLADSFADADRIREHFQKCAAAGVAGFTMLDETEEIVAT